MASHSLERLREEATCSVCLNLMTEPMIIDCGHSYCNRCIANTVDSKPGMSTQTYCCPRCQTSIPNVHLRPNRSLQSLIEAVKEMDLESLCKEHGDRLRLFCEDDGQLICWCCERSAQHQGHATLLVSDACQGYKKKLQEAVKKLKELDAECNRMKRKTRKNIIACLGSVMSERKKVRADFKNLQDFLHEEEKRHLWRLEKERETVLRRLQEGEASLARQSQELQDHIVRLEEKCRASTHMLLLDVKGTLNRSDAVALALPEAVSLSLGTPCNVAELYFDVETMAKNCRGFGASFSSLNVAATAFGLGTPSFSLGVTQTAPHTGSLKSGGRRGFGKGSSSMNLRNRGFNFSKSTGDFKFVMSSDANPEGAKGGGGTGGNFKFGSSPSFGNAVFHFGTTDLRQQVKARRRLKPSRGFPCGSAAPNAAGLSGQGTFSFGTLETKSALVAPSTEMTESKAERLPPAQAGFIFGSPEPTSLPSASAFVWGNTEKTQAPALVTSTPQAFGENTESKNCWTLFSFQSSEQAKNESSPKFTFSFGPAEPSKKEKELPAKAAWTTAGQGAAKPKFCFLQSNLVTARPPAAPAAPAAPACGGLFGVSATSSTEPKAASLFDVPFSSCFSGSSPACSIPGSSLFSQKSHSGQVCQLGSSGTISNPTTTNNTCLFGASSVGANPSTPRTSLPPPDAAPLPFNQAPARFTFWLKK